MLLGVPSKLVSRKLLYSMMRDWKQVAVVYGMADAMLEAAIMMVAIRPYLVVLGGSAWILGLRRSPMDSTSTKLVPPVEFSPATLENVEGLRMGGVGFVWRFGVDEVDEACSPGSLDCGENVTEEFNGGMVGGLRSLFVSRSGYNHLSASCWSSSVVISVDVASSLDQKDGVSSEVRCGTVRKSSSNTT